MMRGGVDAAGAGRSDLYVDGKYIVNNGGLHGPREVCSSTYLNTGDHRVCPAPAAWPCARPRVRPRGNMAVNVPCAWLGRCLRADSRKGLLVASTDSGGAYPGGDEDL